MDRHQVLNENLKTLLFSKRCFFCVVLCTYSIIVQNIWKSWFKPYIHLPSFTLSRSDCELLDIGLACWMDWYQTQNANFIPFSFSGFWDSDAYQSVPLPPPPPFPSLLYRVIHRVLGILLLVRPTYCMPFFLFFPTYCMPQVFQVMTYIYIYKVIALAILIEIKGLMRGQTQLVY